MSVPCPVQLGVRCVYSQPYFLKKTDLFKRADGQSHAHAEDLLALLSCFALSFIESTASSGEIAAAAAARCIGRNDAEGDQAPTDAIKNARSCATLK